MRVLCAAAIACCLGAVLSATEGHAGEVAIVDARAVAGGDGRFTFHVTLEHGDTGWEHYADKWEVLAPDGTVLGTRVLLHPHENEQPFTRSLSEVEIPTGVSSVAIRAHDLVHGDAPQTFAIELER